MLALHAEHVAGAFLANTEPQIANPFGKGPFGYLAPAAAGVPVDSGTDANRKQRAPRVHMPRRARRCNAAGAPRTTHSTHNACPHTL